MKLLLDRLSNPRNRLVLCYDNGGRDNGGTIDRYTVIYEEPLRMKDGNYYEPRIFQYVAMNEEPFHPQGFGQHGEFSLAQMDGSKCRMGRKNHLGKRIPFTDLPEDCRKLVVQDLTA